MEIDQYEVTMFDAGGLLNAVLGAGTQSGQGGPMGGLGGLIGSVLGQGQGSGYPGGGQAGAGYSGAGQPGYGQQAGADPQAEATQVFGQLLNQAATSLSASASGTSLGGLAQMAQQAIGQNPAATSAVLSGLAGLVLGTSTGRNVAANASRLGGLATIGGLAYQAYQSYQAGRSAPGQPGPVAEAPAASPFGTTSDPNHDQQTALTILRAMIAAAASDGQVDAAERATIVNGLRQGGLGAESSAFLDQEFAHPATIDQLVAAADSPETAVQIYTAARLSVHAIKPAERNFLNKLAAELGLDAALVANIEATAQGAKAG
jgi:uncharacterized membrane protein YebE (DUF533 family)